MAVDYTTTALVAAIRRKAMLPANYSKLPNGATDILSIADGELQSLIIPTLLTVRDDYFVSEQDIPLVANKQKYNVFQDSQSSTIMSVSMVDPTTGRAWDLPRVASRRMDEFAGINAAFPACYAVMGETIVLLPTPSSASYKLRVRYERLPGHLVATTEAVTLTSAAGSALTVSGSLPASWAVGTRIRAVNSGPPFSVTMGPASITVIAAGPVVTVGTPDYGAVSDILPTTAGAYNYGDYLCAWNETCVVPLPEAWHAALVYASAAALLKETGDATRADGLRADAEDRMNRLVKLQSNRVRKQPVAVLDRRSPLRRSGP